MSSVMSCYTCINSDHICKVHIKCKELFSFFSEGFDEELYQLIARACKSYAQCNSGGKVEDYRERAERLQRFDAILFEMKEKGFFK